MPTREPPAAGIGTSLPDECDSGHNSVLGASIGVEVFFLTLVESQSDFGENIESTSTQDEALDDSRIQ